MTDTRCPDTNPSCAYWSRNTRIRPNQTFHSTKSNLQPAITGLARLRQLLQNISRVPSKQGSPIIFSPACILPGQCSYELPVLVWFLLLWQDPLTKSNIGGRKGLFQFTGHNPLLRESKSLKQKLWYNDAYWISLTNSLLASSLIWSMTIRLGNGNAYSGLHPPILVNSEENPHRHAKGSLIWIIPELTLNYLK